MRHDKLTQKYREKCYNAAQLFSIRMVVLDKKRLIDIYYKLCEPFNDEIEAIADAIKHFTGLRLKRSKLIIELECLRLNNFEDELIWLRDRVSITELRLFYKTWCEESGHYQTTIFDFLGEDDGNTI